jgi:hypothetical protein
MTDSLTEALRSLSNALSDLNQDLSVRCEAQAKVDAGEFKDLTSALIQKKMEDGIINNFHRESPHQIERIMSRPSQYFRYYKLPANLEFIDVK